ncbi:MAG: proline dehydrogenase family protein [Thermomicrobiales bacterium]|nr:proline dehydrogenase family protein [Thermomicrobiales bacterium]
MHLFRKPVLAVADRPVVEHFVRERRITQGLVRRFIAGETLDEALDATQKLRRLGITATLDQLGENVETAAEASTASRTYVETLDRISAAGMQPNISIKLTMLGLDAGDDRAIENLEPILAAARRVGGFVRIDMEGSAYAERTMEIFEAVHERYPTEVGIVIQTYLHRARRDVERMIERRARVRLVKGAYAEPESVAFQSREEVDDNYRRLMELLLDQGAYPAIATHDPALIALAQAFIAEKQIPTDRFEFQMLYGVRRDAQIALVADGYRMRVYVPYGTEWYPYFTRRIAERPANALFVLRQFISG